MLKFLSALLFISMIWVNFSYAITVETIGEAEIGNGDIPSARAMAISRARWAALEQVSAVEVKIDTIMSNASLADEAVKTTISGAIKSFEVTDEGKDKTIYWVTIKADVAPDGAKAVFNTMAKNTAVAVFIKNVAINGQIQYDSPFARELEKGLAEKGFEVSGLSLRTEKDTILIEKALSSQDFTPLKTLLDKTMSKSMLIGTLEAVSLGNDVGYGTVDFSIVSGSFNWKLVGLQNDKLAVITSGSVSGRGQGATDKAAESNLSANMAKNSAIKVVSEVGQKILGDNGKIVKITLVGDGKIENLKELRNIVKNIPFVLNVKELSLKDLAVNYPEKTYYLASFLQKNNKYRIVKTDDTEIVVERR